ncbi:MAG: hypothetical protein KC492_17465, partial [Myxococcales bacterium]|nr:hypothetical protein [Myxococcales bacterium]
DFATLPDGSLCVADRDDKAWHLHILRESPGKVDILADYPLACVCVRWVEGHLVLVTLSHGIWFLRSTAEEWRVFGRVEHTPLVTQFGSDRLVETASGLHLECIGKKYRINLPSPSGVGVGLHQAIQNPAAVPLLSV